MRRRAALLTVLAFACCVGVARAAQPDAYGVLERGIVDLDRAAALSDAERAPLIAGVIAAIRTEPSLGISAWLIAPLEASTPDLALGRSRFSAALDALGSGSSPAPDSARRNALDTVMAGPPFQTRDLRSMAPEWLLPLVVLIDWLATQIGNMVRWPFDRLGDAYHAFVDGPAYAPFLTGLAILAVMSLILLYRRGLRAALVSETELSAATRSLPPTSAQALERSRRLAAEGRFRDACHFILLSALIWVEEHGQVRFERSATNREHLQQLGRDSPAAPPLRGLVDRFDQLWYGQAEVSAADYRDLEELALRVRQAAA